MNEKITITFLSGDLKDTTGEKVNIMDVFEEDIMLKPFYATEDDIISVFMQDKEKYWDMTRKIIFNAQVKADFFLRNFAFDYSKVTEAQIFQLKRDYVICNQVYQFAKQFNADFLKSVNKTKLLGDLKVTVAMSRAGNGANIIMQDAQACIDELELSFDVLKTGGGGTFMIKPFNKNGADKGSFSPSRQWWPGEPQEPMVSIATRHYQHLGKFYKIGSF